MPNIWREFRIDIQNYSLGVPLFGQIEEAECQFYVREIGLCDHSSLTLSGDESFRDHNLVSSCIVGTGKRPALVHRVNLANCHRLMYDDLNIGKQNTLIILAQNGPTKKL